MPPYGIVELDPAVRLDPARPGRVGCYVRGCAEWLRPARDICPRHGIVCHHSRYGQTYSYPGARRNVIVAPDLLAARVVGHPFKYESGRLGLEKSEDALSWNVFRSLQEVGRLNELARLVTGRADDAEPVLYLWGLCLTGDTLTPWNLLVAARERFEFRLPVQRPQTEPDVGLYLPGRYLILVEAKFTSPNPYYADGPRAKPTDLTKGELLAVYRDDRLTLLDEAEAAAADRVYYQLWRNTVFAEWMARSDGRVTPAYFANLTRAGQEADGQAHFRRMVRPEYRSRFAALTWEGLYRDVIAGRPELAGLAAYLENKTAGLQAAFDVPHPTGSPQ